MTDEDDQEGREDLVAMTVCAVIAFVVILCFVAYVVITALT